MGMAEREELKLIFKRRIEKKAQQMGRAGAYGLIRTFFENNAERLSEELSRRVHNSPLAGAVDKLIAELGEAYLYLWVHSRRTSPEDVVAEALHRFFDDDKGSVIAEAEFLLSLSRKERGNPVRDYRYWVEMSREAEKRAEGREEEGRGIEGMALKEALSHLKALVEEAIPDEVPVKVKKLFPGAFASLYKRAPDGKAVVEAVEEVGRLLEYLLYEMPSDAGLEGKAYVSHISRWSKRVLQMVRRAESGAQLKEMVEEVYRKLGGAQGGTA